MVELSTMIPPHAAVESDLLLATKLHVPRLRAGFLARSRLMDRLEQGADVKLTLVSAPAGSGRPARLLSGYAPVLGRSHGCRWTPATTTPSVSGVTSQRRWSRSGPEFTVKSPPCSRVRSRCRWSRY